MTQHLTMNDLHDQLSKITQKDLILDVRSHEEFSDGHVPGSRNIPHTEVADRQSELKGFEKIYIYCQAGRRAQVAAAMLEDLGFKNLICVSTTGMGHWRAAGFPIEK